MYEQVRNEIMDLLEGRCVCCHTSHRIFLQIDHVNGGGRKERIATGSNNRTILKKIKDGSKEYQLLCANCHAAKTVQLNCPCKE